MGFSNSCRLRYHANGCGSRFAIPVRCVYGRPHTSATARHVKIGFLSMHHGTVLSQAASTNMTFFQSNPRNVLRNLIVFFFVYSDAFTATSSIRTRRHSLTMLSRFSASDVATLQDERIAKANGRIVSVDPLVFVIPHLLSESECQTYRDRVVAMRDRRPLTRSNPPQVSLDLAKLWPLSLLSLGAGIPPVIHLMDSEGSASLDRIVETAMPNIVLSGALGVLFAYLVVLPTIRLFSDRSSRTSVAVDLNQEEDIDFVRPLVTRVSELTGQPWDRWEAPVVTRYDPGAIFARHGDASPTRGSEWVDMGGQRVVTCICYLNSLLSGGETYFDKLDLKVRPECGKALVFFPADSTTHKADDRTTHESLPCEEDKWIVQLFGRAKRVPPPLGLPDSFLERWR